MKLKLDSLAGVAETKVTVLRTDKSAKVKIEKIGNEFVVSNGLASFRLDPDFGGGIHSFKSLDKEWLKSGYPDKKTIFCWYNPWRGGMRPVLRNKNNWMDSVYNEEWSTNEFSEKVGDLEFHGIETQATIKDLKNLEGVIVKTRFLLSEGHRILRTVYILDNIQDISFTAVGGFLQFNNIDNQQKTTQHFKYGTETQRRSGPFGGYHPVEWLITENHDDGKSLLLVKPKPAKEYQVDTNIWLADHGEPYGQHASIDFNMDVKAGEKQEYPLYLVPCKDLDEANKMKGIENL